MGQKLTGMVAENEAERLLQLALALLDASRSFVASAYVAQALAALGPKDAADLDERSDFSEQQAIFMPSSGVLVEK